MCKYTSTLHHYVTLHYKQDRVCVNVFLWLILFMWQNWKIKTNYKGFIQIFEKEWEYNGTVISYLFTPRKIIIQSGGILYNILIGFGIHMKLVRLIKMWLTETNSRSQVGKIFLICFILKWPETRKCIIAIAFNFSFMLSP